MRRCLACGSTFAVSTSSCTACGASPAVVEGFHAYAPELAHDGGGFNASYFSELARLEGTNFWFKARNQFVLWALQKYCPDFRSFLEVGCGTGYVLSGISSAFRNAKLYGSEIFIAGLGFAADRVPSAEFMQMDGRNIPFTEEFDVIGAFDVLEHIDEDERVLKEMHGALKPGGHLVVTVPQHAWLWSSTDEYACHVRRYSAPELRAKIEAAGFRVQRSTSFVTTLLPAMAASRLLQKNTVDDSFDAAKEMEIPSWLNLLMHKFLLAELACIRMGFNFPVGGSRLAVAAKV